MATCEPVDEGGDILVPVDEQMEELVETGQDRRDREAEVQDPVRLVGGGLRLRMRVRAECRTDGCHGDSSCFDATPWGVAVRCLCSAFPFGLGRLLKLTNIIYRNERRQSRKKFFPDRIKRPLEHYLVNGPCFRIGTWYSSPRPWPNRLPASRSWTSRSGETCTSSFPIGAER